jgi:hypothetical protein
MYRNGLMRRGVAAGCVAGLLVLAGCDRRPEPATPPETAPAQAPPPLPVLPILPAPPLGRPELIRAAADATDAFAAGRPHDVAALADRPFQIRLPFSCAGQGPEEKALRYSFDEKTRTLRLTAAVQDWSNEPWVLALAGGETVEAIEGFWIARPWLLSEVCPAPTSALDGPASPETLAIAEVFPKTGSRVARRANRPYTVTRKLAEGEAPPSGGFRLLLEGRLGARAESGGPIRCAADNPGRRPTCIILVTFDRVAFEDEAGAVLGEWTI